MKLCAIGLRGIPNVMGGIESHCQAIYPRLVKKGVDITVIARSPYVEKNAYEYEGIKIIPIYATKSKLFETFLHTFIAIIYARLFVKPNVIHLHAVGPAIFTPFARLLGMKVIVTHHGADYNRAKWSKFAKAVLKFGETMAVKYANRVIVVGKSLTKELKVANPRYSNKIEFIPNGASLGSLETATENVLEKMDLGIQAGNYILSVSRLVPEKGVHDLISAFNKVEQSSKLVIVGDADHEDDYSSNLVKQASENIIFAGRRSGAELASLFKYCRLFVLPSYHEGLPIVALEAMSIHAPVLLSDIAPNIDVGLPEINYFRCGDIEDLYLKIFNTNINFSSYSDELVGEYNWDDISLSTLELLNKEVLK
jgi:glycosyltransferase involved in cell wall biosynthesis